MFATQADASSAVALFQVRATGGDVTPLTGAAAEDNDESHIFPNVLPSGRAVLFTVVPQGRPRTEGHIAVLSLDTGDYHTVIDRGGSPHYVESGHVVYRLDGTLMAVPFDAERLETTGPSVAVVEGIGRREGSFAVSRTGLLVYSRPGGGPADRTLVWVDREGREELLAAPPRAYRFRDCRRTGRRLRCRWRSRSPGRSAGSSSEGC